jgi:hypothetical protein
METVYDWLSMAIFAALIVLFLQRSMMDEPSDAIWHYLPPALGCALANYVGNAGHSVIAVALMVTVAAYILYVLKPFPRRG